ncbi:hypothetical protein [Salipiger thiooxidans]|uniref:hypothetical protein n=1 Tax=Salipiger thiooxidans TaxID=282683 RepID=UPI001CD61808|nr:hypothetical protein [Salipiger thiooxidans]MCA0847702.1 hypothetical protein [Salipiger thiooxidans]
MRASGIPYAGLVLPDPASFDLKRALADAAEVLRRLDGASGEPLRRSSKRAAVMADRLGIAIRPPEPGATPCRAEIRVIAKGGGVPGGELVASVLTQVVLALLVHVPARQIEWFSPDTLIGPEDFVELNRYVSPRRRGAPVADPMPEPLPEPEPARLSPVEEEMALTASIRAAMFEAEAEAAQNRRIGSRLLPVLRQRIRSQKPVEPRSAATGYAATGGLALASVPVAVVLHVASRLRAMDLRFVARVLSVVVIFAVLQNTGVLRQVVTGLMH